MARPAKPWYRDDRKAWYCKHQGRFVRLASGPKDETAVEAQQAFHRLKAGVPPEEGAGAAPTGPTVGELIGLFLDDARAEKKPSTYNWYKNTLKTFRDKHRHDPAEAIRPLDVLAWARGMGNSPNYRRNNIAAVKAVFAWGLATKALAVNPVAETRKPKRRRREAIPSREAALAILAATAGTPLGDLLLVLYDTGCRLQDARRLEARLIVWDHGVAVIPEHKTDGSTGAPKVLPLTDRVLTLLRRLAERWPEGALLRNTRDDAWTQSAVNQAVQAARAKLGMDRSMTPHGFRHRFVTDASRIHSRPVVGQIVGGLGVETIDDTYDHSAAEMAQDAPAMRAAVALVRGSGDPTHPSGETPAAGASGGPSEVGPSARKRTDRSTRRGRRRR